MADAKAKPLGMRAHIIGLLQELVKTTDKYTMEAEASGDLSAKRLDPGRSVFVALGTPALVEEIARAHRPVLWDTRRFILNAD
jgi:hypothetical protein